MTGTTTHVQHIKLPAGSERQRQLLEWRDSAIDIGVDAESINNWKVLSWVREKPTWVTANLYHDLSDHAALASSLILLKSWTHDTIIAIYPVSTLAVNHNLVIEHTSSGPRVASNARRAIPGDDQEVFVVWAVARGSAQRRVVKDVVKKAREVVGGREKDDTPSEFWDGLGVCTWESFGGSSRVPDRPTLDMLLSLVPPLPIKQFLIDDGWQDIVERSCSPGEPGRGRLRSFGPWSGMGGSMNQVVDALKAKGCEHVGVWLTLQGYWVSIDPESPLVQKYKCLKYPTAKRGQPRGGQVVLQPMEGKEGENNWQWIPSPEMAAQFWMDWFTEMKSWGVSFVKVDNQAYYDMIVGPGADHAHQAMWSGLLSAVHAVWGSSDRVIMCMSHNERMLNGPGALDFSRSPTSGNLVFRNSDDFNLPFDNAHPEFLRWNLYATVLTSQLSLVPDFDMFASAPDHIWPTYHALLRSLGPGPLLLSDTPETPSDHALISKLLGKRKDGSSKAVKLVIAAQVVANRWFWDNLFGHIDGPALVAASPVPIAHGALVGAWNAHAASSPARAVDAIGIEDVRDALGVDTLDGEWAVWSSGLSSANRHQVGIFSEEETGPGSGAGSSDRSRIGFELSTGECECFVVAKIWKVGENRIAVVGQMDKFAPLAAVTHIEVHFDRLMVDVEIDSPLTFLYFGPSSPTLSLTVDGMTTSATAQVASSANAGGVWTLTVDLAHSPNASGRDTWRVEVA